MTSTEFNIGYEGSRVSSKVLKPPGGGSSDIFGCGSNQHSMNGSAANECARNKEAQTSTQNRLFGASNDNQNTPSRHGRSNIFANAPPAAPKSCKKPYVRRNPITGEEIEIYPENREKTDENNDKVENGNCEKTENNDKEENGDIKKDDIVQENGEEKKAEVPPFKPVQTSIRVRNPPGGKSSGIF